MNAIIDNVEFTKFVLRQLKMSEEEKQKFLKAVPKMTEKEKAEMIFSIRAEQLLDMSDDLSKKLADPTLTKEEVKKIEHDWSLDTHKKIVAKHEKEKIQEAKDKLKDHGSAPHSPAGPNPPYSSGS